MKLIHLRLQVDNLLLNHCAKKKKPKEKKRRKETEKTKYLQKFSVWDQCCKVPGYGLNVHIVATMLKLSGPQTLHCFTGTWQGSLCMLPWLSFQEISENARKQIHSPAQSWGFTKQSQQQIYIYSNSLSFSTSEHNRLID